MTSIPVRPRPHVSIDSSFAMAILTVWISRMNFDAVSVHTFVLVLHLSYHEIVTFFFSLSNQFLCPNLHTVDTCGPNFISITNSTDHVLTSPNYPADPFTQFFTCVYLVTSTSGSQVVLEILDIKLSFYDYLTIGDGHNTGMKQSELATIKVTAPLGQEYVSSQNKMWVMFLSNNKVPENIGIGYALLLKERPKLGR